ncbi:MAG: hypothetical protein R2707_09570 [Acidimicrobiales bacterium]
MHGTPTASHDILDLTDEAALLAGAGDEIRIGYDPTGARALLSALQLKPVSGPMVDAPRGDVFDLAVYRATGDRRLATLFGTAA